MKKYFSMAVVFSFVFASSALAQTSPVALGYQEETAVRTKVQQERNLVCGSFDKPILIAGYMNYPPFGWKEMVKNEKNDPTAVYYGIGMELFKKFAKEYDLRYQYVNMLNYKEAKYALTRGYFDILLSNYYDANAYSTIRYFYPAYISNPIVIVSLKPTDDKTIIPQTLEDLKGKKGFVRGEENLEDLIYPKLPGDTTVTAVNGAKRAFQGLLRKEIDYLLMSQYAFETEVRRFKIADQVTYAQTPVMSPVIFFSYADGNKCAAFIKSTFEQRLKEYVADEKLIRSILSSQLITWENKFMDERSLMFDTAPIVDEAEQSTKDLDAWLNKQQNGENTRLDTEKKETVYPTNEEKNADETAPAEAKESAQP